VITTTNKTHSIFHISNGPQQTVIKAGTESFDNYQRTPNAVTSALLWGFVPGLRDCYLTVSRNAADFPGEKDLLWKHDCLEGIKNMNLSIGCKDK